jgi:cleavage and polyadenylation specificity factor subunit 1
MLQVVTTFELPGCVDMWTVIGAKDTVEDPNKGEQEYTHAFMILSQQDSTMVSGYAPHTGIPRLLLNVYMGFLNKIKIVLQISNCLSHLRMARRGRNM